MSVDNVDNIFVDPIANLKLILRAILYFQIINKPIIFVSR